MNINESPFYAKVKFYKYIKRELEAFLFKYPEKWAEFKNIFNTILESVSNDILNFEENKTNEGEHLTYKLRKVFEKRYRRHFLHGQYINQCFNKPHGYAGDFEIIDDIYLNQPSSTGFARLWDNFFLETASAKSIRERKEDFKNIITGFVKNNSRNAIRIMSLDSGPTREIKELLELNSKFFSEVIFDCFDYSEDALEYSAALLKGRSNVNFLRKNAIRLALKEDIKSEIPQK
jgi:hypothetical protein